MRTRRELTLLERSTSIFDAPCIVNYDHTVFGKQVLLPVPGGCRDRQPANPRRRWVPAPSSDPRVAGGGTDVRRLRGGRRGVRRRTRASPARVARNRKWLRPRPALFR